MINIKKLDSGIRLVMEKIPYVQSVAMGIWVKTGAVDEEKRHAGISHFIEHMMFKGTETRSARKIAEDVDKIGGQINAFTGREATCYYVKTIDSEYKVAAEVLVDMMENSLFSKEEMDRERQVICEEIKMTQDAPDDCALDNISALVMKGTPLGNSIIGTPTSLNKITRRVITEYKENRYTRDNVVISVAGNFDEEEVTEYFNRKLMALRAEKAVEAEKTVAPYVPGCKVITKDIEQSHICLATRGIALDDDRIYAFSILNNIMGGSMSSRLFQNIREEKGLAYSVYSAYSAFSTDGYYNIYAGISHLKIREAMEGIRTELYTLLENGVTEEEMESSRAQMKSSYVFGTESSTGRMFRNGKNLMLLGRCIDAEEVIGGFDAVTMEDIREVEKLICDFNAYSAVLVTDRKFDLKKSMGR